MSVVRGKSKNLLDKAKESCLLAVDIYNKPKTSFKSGAYIMLMNVAWTSLFHSIFHRKKENYFYKKKNSRYYEKIDGRKKAWELNKCVEVYFKNCNKDEKPIKYLFDFFIPLRNKIEHTYIPELDDDIFGECQSYLHNFEYILSKEFGKEHALNENLKYSIQFSDSFSSEDNRKSKEYLALKNRIVKFRDKLPDEIYYSDKYRFQAVLVPINNPNKADVAIQFIKKEDISPESQKVLEDMLVVIQEKKVPVSDLNMVKAGEVSKEIKRRLTEHYGVDIKFDAGHHHNKCCMVYKCRSPDKNIKKPLNTDFCNYNEAFDDYTYSKKWIEYLYKRLSNPEEFLKLFPQNTKIILDLYSTTEVVSYVKRELSSFYEKNVKFGVVHHNKCAEHYKCKYKIDNIIYIDESFCISVKDKYYFTQDWVDFLIDELTSKDNLLELFPNLL